MRGNWALWATLLAILQFAPFAGFGLSDADYAIFYLSLTDLNFFLTALFAFSLCPWGRLLPKMASFAFVLWGAALLPGNAAIEYFAINMPYEMAGAFVVLGLLIAYGSLRFLKFNPPEIGVLHDDHLYLIVSRPHSVYGAMAAILTGKGGGFVIWHPEGCNLFKYARDGKDGVFKSIHQTSCPKIKIVIDLGPATMDRLEYLHSQIGSKWSWHSNCLTKMGAVKYVL